MGFGHRNCSVFGCHNSGKKLHKWGSQQCEIHGELHGTTLCDCAPPFKLLPFPTERKNNEARKRWIKLINRKESKGELWQPKTSSRVCSEHFVSGKPTEEDPDPILKLGYEAKITLKRKLPTKRSMLPVKRSQEQIRTRTNSGELQ